MSIKQYFGTDGIRGLVGEPPISPDWMLKLGWAVGLVLKSKNSNILIGKDTRISGYMFESALEAGLAAAGCNIGLLGPMPTPAVSYLTNKLNADAGIVISASHNPYYDNGVKFFGKNGNKLSESLELEIERQLEQNFHTVSSKSLGKAKRITNAEEQYVEFCKNSFPAGLNLNNVKLVIDCANGANYKIAPLVFKSLGAKVEVIAASPDGLNINVNCGSTNPKLLIKAIKEHQADVGIAFDGDGDRVILVDGITNQIIDGDDLLYIIANWYLTSGKKLTGVIGTIMSNLGLEKALSAMGLSFIRTNVGDRYIFEELIKRRWQLGGEASGHIICRNVHATGDGIIAALQVLAAMTATGKNLSELLQPMEKYPQILINVPIKAASSYKKILNNINFKKAYKYLEKKLQGKGNEGRVVIRPSGTEPVMRVMVEGSDKKLINIIAKELEQVILGVPLQQT
jgi:phosphoglucosamine mutase